MFDPNIPQAGTEIDAVQMRGQLNGLKSLIDAIVSIIAAVVDSVTTVNPGDPAAVSVSIINNELHFTFAIPRGDEGLPGTAGTDGAQGPPFAQAIIDAVNTLNPGDPATVSVSFDGTNVHFIFGIPRGEQGMQGIQGIPGIDGGQGIPGTNGTNGTNGTDGAPGEVTNAQLAGAISTAISGTSNNTNAVATMDTPFTNDPPTLADMELMRAKMNEFILTARR